MNDPEQALAVLSSAYGHDACLVPAMFRPILDFCEERPEHVSVASSILQALPHYDVPLDEPNLLHVARAHIRADRISELCQLLAMVPTPLTDLLPSAAAAALLAEVSKGGPRAELAAALGL